MQKGKDKVRRDILLIYPARQALGTNGRKRGQGTRGTHARDTREGRVSPSRASFFLASITSKHLLCRLR